MNHRAAAYSSVLIGAVVCIAGAYAIRPRPISNVPGDRASLLISWGLLLGLPLFGIASGSFALIFGAGKVKAIAVIGLLLNALPFALVGLTILYVALFER